MAEARGFEPPEPQGFNTLARCRLRPLGHASDINGGGHRIRTCGPVKDNGFQNHRFRPLSQSSSILETHLRIEGSF